MTRPRKIILLVVLTAVGIASYNGYGMFSRQSENCCPQAQARYPTEMMVKREERQTVLNRGGCDPEVIGWNGRPGPTKPSI